MAGAYEESRKNSPSALPSYGAYKESRKGSVKSSKKSKSVTPKVVNKNTRVTQAQIDQIKKLGMTKALAMVKANKGSVRQGAVEITNEAVRRLYGQERFDKAMGRAKRPAGSTPKQAKAKSNFTYSAPVASKKPAKKPMTPYQKDMARRGIY
jgi:beta-mannanase